MEPIARLLAFLLISGFFIFGYITNLDHRDVVLFGSWFYLLPLVADIFLTDMPLEDNYILHTLAIIPCLIVNCIYFRYKGLPLTLLYYFIGGIIDGCDRQITKMYKNAEATIKQKFIEVQ